MATQGGAVVLEPMGIGDILDRTFRLYRDNFLNFIGIACIPQLAVLALLLVAAPLAFLPKAGRLTPAVIVPLAISAVAFFFAIIALSFLSMAAIARSVSERYLGRAPMVLEAYKHVLRRALSLLWAYILWGLLFIGLIVVLAVGGGIVGGGLAAAGGRGLAVLAVVPFVIVGFVAGIIMAVRFLFITQVVILEQVGGVAALRRSWRLTRKNFWRAVVIILLWVVLWGIGSLIFNYPIAILGTVIGGQGSPLAAAGSAVGGQLAQILVSPFYMIAFTLLYYDSRIRKEGFDLEVMAQGLGFSGEGPPAGAPIARAAAGGGESVPGPTGSPAPAPSAASPGADLRSARPLGAGPGGAKTCPQCGTLVPNIRPLCPSCGARVPFGANPSR